MSSFPQSNTFSRNNLAKSNAENDSFVSGQLVSSSALLFYITWMCWFSIAAIFTYDTLSQLIPLIAIFCMASSILLILQSPVWGLYLLPMAMMLGPIYRFDLFKVGFITIGDLYSLLMIARSFYLGRNRFCIKFKVNKYLLVGALLIILSSILSESLSASIVGMIKIIQYTLLYRVTRLLVTREYQIDILLKMWVAATSICAIMMMWLFYVKDTNLQMLMISGESQANIDLSQSGVLLRPTFFYTNIFIPLGFGIVICTSLLALPGFKEKMLTKLLLIMALCVNTIALLLNNSKSMIFPVVFVCAALLIWRIWKSLATFNVISLILIMVFFPIVIIYGFTFISNLVGAYQIEAMANRISDLSSLEMRMSVWTSVFEKLVQDPIRLFFGFGPQATARQGDQGAISQLLTGVLGNKEGAFDSTPIGLIVEYGFMFFILIVISLVSWAHSVWKYFIATRDSYAVLFLLLFLVAAVCHVTQQYGLSPAGLIVLQLFAVARYDNAVPIAH